VAVVQQPVQDCGCHNLVAQHGTPVADGAVGRNQDAAPFVTAADKLEQQMGGCGLKWQISELVHDQQLGFGQLGEPLLQLPLRMPSDQCRHQRRRRREQHRVAMPDRLAPECDGQVRLADTGRTRGILPNITTPMGGSFIGITLATVRSWKF
jgi:hypothetical protein